MHLSKSECTAALDRIVGSGVFHRKRRLGPLLRCLARFPLEQGDLGFIHEDRIYHQCFSDHGDQGDRRLTAGTTLVSTNLSNLAGLLRDYRQQHRDGITVTLERGGEKLYRLRFEAAEFRLLERWYKLATFHLDQQEPYHLAKAEEYLAQVLAAEPLHPGALAAKAELECFMSMQDATTSAAQRLESARRDVELARERRGAYPAFQWRIEAALGAVQDWQLNFASAAGHFAEAMRLNPTGLATYEPYFGHLVSIGRIQEAIEWATHQVDLRPEPITYRQLGMCLYVAGRFDDAAEALETSLEADRSLFLGHLTMALVRLAQSRPSQALEHITVVTDAAPGAWPGFRIHCLAAHGATTLARQELTDLESARASGRYVQPLQLAFAYSGLGDHESAARALLAACEDYDPLMTWLHVWPLFAPTRNACPAVIAQAMSRFRFPTA